MLSVDKVVWECFVCHIIDVVYYRLVRYQGILANRHEFDIWLGMINDA